MYHLSWGFCSPRGEKFSWLITVARWKDPKVLVKTSNLLVFGKVVCLPKKNTNFGIQVDIHSRWNSMKLLHGIHPERLTWNLRIHPWKKKIILQTIMFMFYANLPGCDYHALHQNLKSSFILRRSYHLPPMFTHIPKHLISQVTGKKSLPVSLVRSYASPAVHMGDAWYRLLNSESDNMNWKNLLLIRRIGNKNIRSPSWKLLSNNKHQQSIWTIQI